MVGVVLQILTIMLSLLTGWFLSRKGKERWGYLIGFCSLPLWVIMEAYYQQWFYFFLNPVYFVMWGMGLKNHWKVRKEETDGNS